MSDKKADAARRAELSKHYPDSVIAPWERVPEPIKDEYRDKTR